MPRTAVIGLILACCLSLAACGSSSTNGTTSAGRIATTATTPSTGLASKSPGEVLAATAAAMATVRSYHVVSTQVDDDGRSRITADVTSDGRFRGHMQMGSQTIDVVAIGADTYLKANRAYWDEIGGPGARHLGLLANRWVKAPGAATASLRNTLDKLRPDHMALCLRKAGTASGVVNQGERRWRGLPVVVLHDPGGRPGTSPGDLYVAATGEPRTLRETQTGPRRPGGHVDRDCDDPDSTARRGDSVFSDYDKPVKIQPPPNALDLDRLVPPKDLTPA